MDTQGASQGRRYVPRRTNGFSLLELLFVLLVLAVVVAVFLPVTRNARPAARRVQCRNNLKQISLAAQLSRDLRWVSPYLHHGMNRAGHCTVGGR